MKGKVVPIMKLERLAREDLDICRKMYKMWLETTNLPTRDYWIARRIKWLDMAEKKLEQILLLRDTAPSLAPPFKVKEDSTDICDSSDELIPSYFFEEMVDSTNSSSSKAKEVSTVVKSIQPAVNEPKKDSIDAVSHQFKEIRKAEVSYFDNKNHVQVFEIR
ncbi:uncharacterized protein LOC113281485 [Papaver somniferum]|uniref:uncharacterized protein LOC113281485 n=1 Tax=Papaver somniferum TaxID=3469 RepID=UPI000E6FD1FF|nr:uncharacterized protein LOC113281485 [Papaver somniferum]